jgi:hypothetical protein
MKIPTYKEALERHETPLDDFVSRWEPAKDGGYKVSFRQDLQALIDYFEQQHVIDDGFGQSVDAVCGKCGRATMQVMRPGDFRCGECER